VIYSNNKKEYNCNSYLLDFLKEQYNYDESPLLFSSKYSNGTFTITIPNTKYKNCEYINDYPHFTIPLEVCLKEIHNFLSDIPLYDNNFMIRYGDTHPHKIIPKLAQIRNLLIEEQLSSMILTSGEKKSVFTIGDISLKTFEAVAKEIGNSDDGKIVDVLTKYIFHNENVNEKIIRNWEKYCLSAKEKLISFLSQNGFKIKNLILESSLYKNSDIYNYLKSNILCSNGIRDDGSFKYILQELIFILSVKEENQILFNIIGENQMEHVLEVLQVSRDNNIHDDFNFLTCGVCKNGDYRNIDEWSRLLNHYIISNKLEINDTPISPINFLKIIVCSLNNSTIIDYSKLGEYRKYFESYKLICSSRNNYLATNDSIIKSNVLMNNMALVNYYLHKSIKSGEQSRFFKYLFSVSKEYMSNLNEYIGISALYDKFVLKCLERLSLN